MMPRSRPLLIALLTLASLAMLGGCEGLTRLADATSTASQEGFEVTADDEAAAADTIGDELVTGSVVVSRAAPFVPQPWGTLVGLLGAGLAVVGKVMLTEKRQRKTAETAVQEIAAGVKQVLKKTPSPDVEQTIKSELAATQSKATQRLVALAKVGELA